MVAVEALGQLAADLRPFEVEPGSIDRVRAEGAVRIGDAVARGGVRRALSETVDRLAAVPRRPLRPLPAVGLVGDLFTRVNDPANGFLIRRIEQAGCRVLLSPTLTDLATAVTGERVHLGLLSRDWRQVARELALETYTRLSGTWVAGPVGKIVPPRRLDPSWRESEALVRPYLGRTGETALTANVAQTVRHLEAGAAGVLSVICHGCMIGILSEASYRLIREAYPDRPILSLTYDGLGDTHAATRVEAFLQRVTAGG
jgi:predicted nucleotide-binding protein (sugar kinase/HSP70/actin superfamily)